MLLPYSRLFQVIQQERYVPLFPGKAPVAPLRYETHGMSPFSQSQVRIVFSEQQPVLRPRREHTVRLGNPLCHEVVNENTDVGLRPVDHHRLPPLHFQCSVDPGNDTLRSRFFVTRRPVDLPGVEEVCNGLRLKAVFELHGICEVVLDGVSRPHDLSFLKPRNRA